MRALFAAALALVMGALPLVAPAPALAHPLGNFTVNRYARLELSPERVRVRYVLDLAEIPTFQAASQLDADGNGAVSDAERVRFAERQLAEAVRNLHLTMDGRRVALRPSGAEAELLPGQAGLQTLRLSGWADAPGVVARDGSQVALRDENEPGKIGWREIVVQTEGISPAGLGPTLTRDLSNELRAYPEDLLNLPPDVRAVSFVAVADDRRSTADEGLAPSTSERSSVVGPPWSDASASLGLTELVTTATLTPAVVALALLTALILGGMHALSPGHGKTIVGAYLVGSRGTPKHALFLGLTVTVVHTAGVFALLLVTLFASQYVVPEQFFPWMSLASGLLVVWIGLGLVRSRWRGVVGSRRYAAGSGEHTHDHDGLEPHSHGFGSHTHAVPGADGAPVTWRSLLALGISGGLLPCPSALVLGLGAIALNRALYGLVLILFFSAGLAATLMAIGLVMVYSGRAAGRLRLLERLGATAGGRVAAGARVLPVVSAGVVALAGLALSGDALRQLDVPRLWETSATFRTVAANALSVSVGAVAVLIALRRKPRPDLAHAHGHAHTHGHNVHQHDHSHGHDHGHSTAAGHSHEATAPAAAAYVPEEAPARR